MPSLKLIPKACRSQNAGDAVQLFFAMLNMPCITVAQLNLVGPAEPQLSSSGFNGCILLLVCVNPPQMMMGTIFYRIRSIPGRLEVATVRNCFTWRSACLPLLKCMVVLMVVFICGGLRWFPKGPPPTQKYRGAA
jgi:hypothetical protein